MLVNLTRLQLQLVTKHDMEVTTAFQHIVRDACKLTGVCTTLCCRIVFLFFFFYTKNMTFVRPGQQDVYTFLEYAFGEGSDLERNTSDKNKAMRQSKTIPNLIYSIEQFDRYILQVTRSRECTWLPLFSPRAFMLLLLLLFIYFSFIYFCFVVDGQERGAAGAGAAAHRVARLQD